MSEELQILLESFKPADGEFVIWKFPYRQYPDNQLRAMWETIRDTFPNNVCFGVPKDCDLEHINRKQLQDIADSINSILMTNEEIGCYLFY